SYGLKLRCRFQSETVLTHAGLRGIAEWLKDRLAFVPITKLVGIMAAAELARLSRRDQKNRFVPIPEIGHESHCRPMAFGSCTNAVAGARLWLARNAENCLQSALSANRMKHVQRVELPPLPVFDARTLRI